MNKIDYTIGLLERLQGYTVNGNRCLLQEDVEYIIKNCGILNEDNGQVSQEVAEKYFPELKQSEDEKIRKEIKQFIQYMNDVDPRKANWLAWLEKQGEQKPLDYENANIQQKDFALKVEPKFKVGDWVVQENIGVYKVIEICESWYEVIDFEDNHYSISFDKEYMCHLWTIDDAKDGDVLYSLDSNRPFIYKERNDYEQATAYCGLNIYGKFFVWGTKDCVITLSNYVPATKEQRDLLFQKMREAGYGWYANKKELMKISRDKIYTYDIRKNTMEEHEILETDACKFHFFNHNGSRCSYDSRGATVQLLNYRNTDDEYVLVSVDKQSLGWIKESYEKVISDFRFKCVNAILDTIKL